MFDGVSGWAAAKVMAHRNRETEREAIEVLDPSLGDSVLGIGIGPGVGISQLAERLGAGRVAGVDPSAVMVAVARRRNRCWINRGRVEIVRTGADELPWPDRSFDGALAVNSIQMWDPIEASVVEVGRVLRPGAHLVALTHDWAITHDSGRTVDAWFAWMREICCDTGLVDARYWRARAENGRSVAFMVTRSGS